MLTKILVVDDEPDIVDLICFSLEKEGFTVFRAGTGTDALNKARAVLPDLIILDVTLPELDGITVCEILRRLPSTSGIPVVMITGWDTDAARQRGAKAGAREYVNKPFSSAALTATIKRLLTPVEVESQFEVEYGADCSQPINKP